MMADVVLLQHGLAVGMPFGLALGTLLVWIRLAAVDYRQWFRDPAQPLSFADDSWIGLALQDLRISSTVAISLTLILALYTWGGDGLRTLCCFLGTVLGAALAQACWEFVWRFGLAVVPDALPPERFLSGAPIASAPVPPKRLAECHRRLIVCCDGTWNWPNPKQETNVVRLLRAIVSKAYSSSGATISQISYYHPGVGTGNVVDQWLGGAVGIGLSNSVKACYGFLVDNYVRGDEILLFGFSRGAYVARSVAGMIGSIGLMRRWEMDRFIEAWDWYTLPRDMRDVKDLDRIAPERDPLVDIECIGVWDTVGALGIPGTRLCARSFAFHETQLGAGVRYAFQALALDERRGNFQAAVWSANPSPRTGQVLEQVWFPGVHSNVGGGYEKHGLSDCALLWMLSRLSDYELLELDLAHLGASLDGTEPYPGGTLENSRRGIWRVIGSPCPRPVGLTSPTERIHESAFVRDTE